MNDLVFASCSAYALGCIAGPRQAVQMITDAVQAKSWDLTVGPVLAVGTLRELLEMTPVALRVDGGATHIGKSRSRHLSEALRSKADTWLTVDDDVLADGEAVGTVLAAVDSESEPRVCIAPYLLRGKPDVVGVEWSEVNVTRAVHFEGEQVGRVRTAKRGGFGLVAMNRLAMEAAADVSPWFRDDDGRAKPAAFLEVMQPTAGDSAGTKPLGRWLGEDLAFFERLPSNVLVEAAVSGTVQHGELELELSQLESQ